MTAVQMAIVDRRYTISGEGYSTEGQIAHTGGQDDVPLEPLLLPMALCADAEVKDGALVGDPTEGALVVLAAKGGVDPTLTREQYPRVATLPFDAAYKFMATFHRMKNDSGKDVIRCYVKGAPDQLLARAGGAHGPDGKDYPINDDLRERYLAENDRLGAQGLRVLATAQRDFDPGKFDPNADLLPLIADLQLLALVGIVDPPRAEARDAIAKAHSAGIQVRMITGDHAVTAEAIARQLGIEGRAITGAEFSAMSEDEADRAIDDIGVIARVAPEDKVHLVEILRRKGHIVAMTGDGVNDAPALKAADIGVAMGITGTEVSKEAAVMILTDDNFATIVNAVEQGRALYDNLMRYIRFQMASLFGFIATFLGASIFNIFGGIPFLPLQTLWINFTVTVFQAVGLGYSKPRDGLMEDPPRSKDAVILPRPLLIWLVFVGLVFAAMTLPMLVWASNTYDEVVGPHDGPRHVLAAAPLVLARDLGRGPDDLQQPAPREPDAAQGVGAVGAHGVPRHDLRTAPADPRHDRADHRAVGDLHRRVARRSSSWPRSARSSGGAARSRSRRLPRWRSRASRPDRPCCDRNTAGGRACRDGRAGRGRGVRVRPELHAGDLRLDPRHEPRRRPVAGPAVPGRDRAHARDLAAACSGWRTSGRRSSTSGSTTSSREPRSVASHATRGRC